MNASNAKDYLPMVQALAEGRVIEHRGSGGWYQLNNPSFQDPPSDYRIKPEPKELWTNRYSDGSESPAYESREVAESDADEDDPCVQVCYREVIE